MCEGGRLGSGSAPSRPSDDDTVCWLRGLLSTPRRVTTEPRGPHAWDSGAAAGSESRRLGAVPPATPRPGLVQRRLLRGPLRPVQVQGVRLLPARPAVRVGRRGRHRPRGVRVLLRRPLRQGPLPAVQVQALRLLPATRRGPRRRRGGHVHLRRAHRRVGLGGRAALSHTVPRTDGPGATTSWLPTSSLCGQRLTSPALP